MNVKFVMGDWVAAQERLESPSAVAALWRDKMPKVEDEEDLGQSNGSGSDVFTYVRINRKKVAQMPSGSSHVVHKICSVIFWRSEKCEILRKCEGEYKSFNSYEYFNTEKFEDENDCIRPNPSNSELLRPFKGKFAIVQVGCIALPFRPELVNVTNSWRI